MGMQSVAAVYHRLERFTSRHDLRSVHDWMGKRADFNVHEAIKHALLMAYNPFYRQAVEAERFAREYEEMADERSGGLGAFSLNKEQKQRVKALREAALTLRTTDSEVKTEIAQREVERLLGVMRAEIESARAPVVETVPLIAWDDLTDEARSQRVEALRPVLREALRDEDFDLLVGTMDDLGFDSVGAYKNVSPAQLPLEHHEVSRLLGLLGVAAATQNKIKRTIGASPRLGNVISLLREIRADNREQAKDTAERTATLRQIERERPILLDLREHLRAKERREREFLAGIIAADRAGENSNAVMLIGGSTKNKARREIARLAAAVRRYEDDAIAAFRAAR